MQFLILMLESEHMKGSLMKQPAGRFVLSYPKETIKRGNTEGKSQMAELMKRLLDENRIEDAKRAAEDPAYCDELMKQYGIG